MIILLILLTERNLKIFQHQQIYSKFKDFSHSVNSQGTYLYKVSLLNIFFLINFVTKRPPWHQQSFLDSWYLTLQPAGRRAGWCGCIGIAKKKLELKFSRIPTSLTRPDYSRKMLWVEKEKCHQIFSKLLRVFLSGYWCCVLV